MASVFIIEAVPELQISAFRFEEITERTSYGATVLRATLRRTPNHLTASFIIKMPVTEPLTFQNQMTAAILLCVALFYRNLADNNRLDSPKIYHLAIHEDDFEIVMEDLGYDHRETLNNLSIDQIKRSLVSVAALHPIYWNHDILKQVRLKHISDDSRESRGENLASISRTINIQQSNHHDASPVRCH